MEEYQKRVIKEQEDLQNKINNLQAFLDTRAIDQTWITLHEQLIHMHAYSAVLLRRIEEF